MVSRTVTKFIKSLQLKKYRKIEQRFIVEGEKSVLEVLQSSYKVQQIVATPEFQHKHQNRLKSVDIINATQRELSSLGNFKSNNSALAIVEIKPNTAVSVDSEYVLALDGINDPGNLGTIIRVADWYGIKKIIASGETADFYNPKVVSASKGSFTRVELFYTYLPEYLKSVQLTIYGTYMKGENIHKTYFEKEGIIVLGNESNGISKELEPYISRKISISRKGEAAESLNVGVAAAVICDNVSRVT
ncbi:MAG: RNA methyltransferase [Bacteroidota bacterium]